MKRAVLLLGIWCLALCAMPLVLGLWLLLIVTGTQRAWRVAVGYDQLLNVHLGGSEDETISSRAGRAMLRGERWGCVLCRMLDKFESDHCRRNIGT